MNRIHGPHNDVLCGIQLTSFPSGMSQKYDAGIEKQLTYSFYPVLLDDSWRQIPLLQIMLLIRLLVGISFFDVFYQWWMSQKSSPALQLLQTGKTYLKTVPFRPMCYYHLAVLQHTQPEENLPKCVCPVPDTACAHRCSWARWHKPDKWLELDNSEMRQTYFKNMNKLRKQFWKVFTVAVPEHSLSIVVEVSFSRSTRQHWKICRLHMMPRTLFWVCTQL